MSCGHEIRSGALFCDACADLPLSPDERSECTPLRPRPARYDELCAERIG